jgi:hypothetical protein
MQWPKNILMRRYRPLVLIVEADDGDDDVFSSFHYTIFLISSFSHEVHKCI